MSTKAPTLIPHAQTRANLDLAMRLARRWQNMDLKTYKALKIGILSLTVVGYAIFSVQKGADPTFVFTGTVVLLAMLNGVEVTELISAWIEIRSGQSQQRHRQPSEPQTKAEEMGPAQPPTDQDEQHERES